MSLFNVMQISSTGMEAENVRLNTTASNIANANSVSSSYDETYRARHPVFATALQDAMRDQSKGAGVQVKGIVESDAPLQVEYSPNNPMADENGYIYKPDIDAATEMAEMMQASRSFQNSVEAINTAKQLALRTLTLGK